MNSGSINLANFEEPAARPASAKSGMRPPTSAKDFNPERPMTANETLRRLKQMKKNKKQNMDEVRRTGRSKDGKSAATNVCCVALITTFPLVASPVAAAGGQALEAQVRQGQVPEGSQEEDICEGHRLEEGSPS